jgi:hypothetical protein
MLAEITGANQQLSFDGAPGTIRNPVYVAAGNCCMEKPALRGFGKFAVNHRMVSFLRLPNLQPWVFASIMHNLRELPDAHTRKKGWLRKLRWPIVAY